MENQIILPEKRKRVKKNTEVIETEINSPKVGFFDRLKLVKSSFAYKLDEVLIYIIVFLTPLFFLPFTDYPLSLGKQAFVFFALAISFLILIFGVVSAGRFKIGMTLPMAAALLLIVSSVASWLVNGGGIQNFFGIFGGESSTPVNVLSFFFVFLLTQSILSGDEKKQKKYLFLFALSSVFSVLIWICVQNGIIGSLVSGFTLTNTIGMGSSFVLFLIAGFFISLGLYFESDGIIKKSLYAAFLALFFFVFILLGFKLVWYLISLGLAFFIAAYFANKQNYESKKAYIFVIIMILAVSLVFAFSSAMANNETRVTYGSSVEITKNIYKTGSVQMLLGSGPASFKHSFLKYRDTIIPDINLNRLQFVSGYSTATDYFSELGIIGGVSILLFFISAVFYGIRLLLLQIKNNIYSPLTISLLAAMISSFTVNIFGASNFTNLFVSFALSALVVGAYKREAGKESRVVNFSKNSSQTFFMLIVLIGFLASVAFLAFKFGSKYTAEIYFRKAQKEIVANNSQGAFLFLEKAIKFNNQDDTYFRSAADLNLPEVKKKLEGLNKEDKKAVEELTSEIKNVERLYNQAIVLNSNDASNWLSLGALYELISDTESAQKSYEKALSLDPKNADILFLAGKAYYDNGKYSEAEKRMSELATIFPQDANIRFYRALTFMQEGKKDEAVNEFEVVKTLDPKNAAVIDQTINNIKEQDNIKEEK